MPQFNGDIIFLDGSGQVRSTNGSLTLRGDDTGTKSIIIGSGMSLRPETDVRIDLGRPDLRWHRLHTGAITATSGILSFLTFNENSYVFTDGLIETNGSNVDINLSSQLTIDGTSNLLVNGIASFFGSAFTLAVDPRPNLDNTWKFGTHGFRFSEFYANSGIFNYISPLVSGTYITLDGSLIPNKDRIYTLGSATRRFSEVRSSSGIFNSLTPPTSGSFIDTIGSLVPNRTALYSLGTNSLRWGNIFATSGNITTLASTTISATTVTATQVTGDTVSANNLLEITADGGIFSHRGSLNWDGNGTDVIMANVTQWDWGSANLLGIGSIDAVSLALSTTLSAASASFTSVATATTFAKRPRVNGSGIALSDENYYEAYGGRIVNLGATVANDIYQVDASAGAVANGDDHFINTRAAKLINYAVSTQHLNGSQPSGWFIRMRLNEDAQFWASGAIYFNASTLTNGRIVGQWNGNTHIPSGSRVRLSLDNNGGSTVNIVFSKVWVGLAVSGTTI